jgi:NitT/TauT family transport system substrate-binding protein
MKIRLFALVIVLGWLPALPGAAQELQSMRLMLQWSPQAQFAGFYVAREKGFYARLGLDLEIIAGGPDRVVSDYLGSGRVEFGTMFLTTAMERRAAGMPLVNIGQLLHHSSLMLIARADSGVDTLADLDHKKVSIWANEFQIPTRMLFKQAGIEVELIPLASSMELFLRGAVTATSAMWYNEYHTILSAGVREDELHLFFFRDTAYDFPEDGLYCLENTLINNREAADAVLKGTLAGWEYAFAHEQEALEIVARAMTRARLPVNRAHQRWMFRRMRDIMVRDKVVAAHGVLNRKTFSTVSQQLVESGAVRSSLDYDSFYKGPTR